MLLERSLQERPQLAALFNYDSLNEQRTRTRYVGQTEASTLRGRWSKDDATTTSWRIRGWEIKLRTPRGQIFRAIEICVLPVVTQVCQVTPVGAWQKVSFILDHAPSQRRAASCISPLTYILHPVVSLVTRGVTTADAVGVCGGRRRHSVRSHGLPTCLGGVDQN